MGPDAFDRQSFFLCRNAERALEAQPGGLGFSIPGEQRSGVPRLEEPGRALEQRPERLDGAYSSPCLGLGPDATRIKLVGLGAPDKEGDLVGELSPTVRVAI